MGASGYAGCLLARVAPLWVWVFRRENSVFGGWGTSQYHLLTYNNLTADLLPTRRVPCHQPGAGLAGWAKNPGVLPLEGKARSEKEADDHGATSNGVGVAVVFPLVVIGGSTHTKQR
jgi:hypothetical protein